MSFQNNQNKNNQNFKYNNIQNQSNSILQPSKYPKYNNEINQILYNNDNLYFSKDKILNYSVKDFEHIKQVLKDNNFIIVNKIKEGGYGKILLIKSSLNNLTSIAKVVSFYKCLKGLN